MKQEEISISVRGDKLVFEFENFDDQDVVNIDLLMTIDYLNIPGEICNFPAVVNKLGLTLAFVEDEVRESKFDLEVYSAKLREAARNSLTEVGARGAVKKPSSGEVEDVILLDKGYQARLKVLNGKTKKRDIISTLFWNAKSKLEILAKLSSSLERAELNEPQSLSKFLKEKIRKPLIS